MWPYGGLSMAMFKVERFSVPHKKPRNKYPLRDLKRPGDGFVIEKKDLPKGSLHGIGRYLGLRLTVETLENGDKRVVLVSKRQVESSGVGRRNR